MFAAQCRLQQFRLQPVDDLDPFDLPRIGEQVDQHAVEGQRRKVALLQFRNRDAVDQARIRVRLRIRIVEAIDVFDQGMGRAAVAFGKQVGAGIGAVRRDAPELWRVFPDRERRVAVADHPGGRLDEEGQHVPQDLRGDRHHAVRRQQRSKQMGVAERIDDRELRQHPGGQAEIDADRGDVPAADAPSGADDQLGGQGLDQRVGGLFAVIEDRSPADLHDVTEGQHGHYRRFGRGHDPLVEQTLAHQHRLDVMPPIGRQIDRRGRGLGIVHGVMTRVQAVITVPTGSPFSARVKLPFLRPLMIWIERRCLAFFIS